MGGVQAFESVEAMMDAIRAGTEAADRMVQGFQKVLEPGMFYLSIDDNLLFIYGEILDPAKRMDGEPFESEEQRLEYEEDALRYSEPGMANYRFVRAASRACPDGEPGDMHISVVACVLTNDQYEAAKAAGWPGAELFLAGPLDEESARELLRIRHAVLRFVEHHVMEAPDAKAT